MTNLLDGAGDLPPENERATTPGAFAARWNARNDTERQAWLDAVHAAFDARERCFRLNHDRIRELAEQQAQLLTTIRARCSSIARDEDAADAERDLADEIVNLLDTDR